MKSSGKLKPQQETDHPEDLRRDLSPDHMTGQNIGPDAAQETERGGPAGPRTAYEHKAAHQRLRGMSDADLKQIPVLRCHLHAV